MAADRTGAIKANDSRAGVESTIDSYILKSWRRSADQHHLDRYRPSNPLVLTPSELQQRRERLDRLLSISEPELLALYERIKDAGYVVMLADTAGVCLSLLRNSLMDRELASKGLELGRVYAEDVEGTCGIGTAIAEHRPVVIHHDEHFFAIHQRLSCTAVPIDAPDGSMAGVLDASALTSHEDKRSQLLVLQLVKMTAESIENKLILSTKRSAHSLIYLYESALVAQGVTNAFLVMREDGVIEGASKAAIRLVPELGDATIRRTTGDCLGISPALLRQLMSGRHGEAAKIFPPGRIAPLFARMDLSSRGIVSIRSASLVTGSDNVIDIDDSEAPLKDLQELAGEDVHYRRLVATLPRMLNNNLPILVQGETGCGKEMFAQAFHRASDRRNKPFVAIDCSSLSESLIESELFGYKDGAFTGARKGGSRGKIIEAHGGTLFLDEIGDMPLGMQSRLLRVIAQREVMPLGGTASIPVDFRLICATHRNLAEMVGAGAFREDLFYRIHGAVFALPSLRERTDKALLIRKQLAKAIEAIHPGLTIEDGLVERLAELPWPGNIRQLDHAIRYAVSVAEHSLGAMDFPAAIADALQFRQGKSCADTQPGNGVAAEALQMAEQLPSEARELVRALEQHKWQIKSTAQSLGISRATIYRRMDRYGIVEPNKRSGYR